MYGTSFDGRLVHQRNEGFLQEMCVLRLEDHPRLGRRRRFATRRKFRPPFRGVLALFAREAPSLESRRTR
ncbi:MAG: hypothetical protein ACR2HO_07790 [Rubrobacteraceae bacterium]